MVAVFASDAFAIALILQVEFDWLTIWRLRTPVKCFGATILKDRTKQHLYDRLGCDLRPVNHAIPFWPNRPILGCFSGYLPLCAVKIVVHWMQMLSAVVDVTEPAPVRPVTVLKVAASKITSIYRQH